MNTRRWLIIGLCVACSCVERNTLRAQVTTPIAEKRTALWDVSNFVLTRIDESNEFLSFSSKEGTWDRYKFSDKVKATPFIDPDAKIPFAYFQLEGDSIAELVGIDEDGRFCKHPLLKPAKGKLVPNVLQYGLVMYVVDGKAYAFSAKAGRWDAIDLPQSMEQKLDVGKSAIFDNLLLCRSSLLFKHEDKLSAFALETGKWSTETFEGASRCPIDVLSGVIIAGSPVKTHFITFDERNAKWNRFNLERGVRGLPVYETGGSHLVHGVAYPAAAAAFQLEGNAINELVALDAEGQACRHNLPMPAAGPLIPRIFNGTVFYVVDGYVHAFSTATATWDSLEAPHLKDERTNPDGSKRKFEWMNPCPSIPGARIFRSTIVVEFDDQLASFSYQTGKWSIEKKVVD